MRGVSNFQYLGHQNPNDSTMFPSIGGKVIQMQANTTLNIGDAVQIVGVLTVGKLTSLPEKVIGVVVGGDSFLDGGIFESSGYAADVALIAAGTLAATVSQKVFVLVHGVFYVIADGSIANGAQFKISVTTAGRVTAATSALTIAAGATAVTSSAANGAIISGDDAGADVMGKLIDTASSVAGDIRLAYINVR